MSLIEQHGHQTGILPLCQALEIPRASFYRQQTKDSSPAPSVIRPRPEHALSLTFSISIISLPSSLINGKELSHLFWHRGGRGFCKTLLGVNPFEHRNHFVHLALGDNREIITVIVDGTALPLGIGIVLIK